LQGFDTKRLLFPSRTLRATNRSGQACPYLKQHKIPYEIVLTDACVKWLMRIAEVKPFLDEYLGTPLED